MGKTVSYLNIDLFLNIQSKRSFFIFIDRNMRSVRDKVNRNFIINFNAKSKFPLKQTFPCSRQTFSISDSQFNCSRIICLVES